MHRAPESADNFFKKYLNFFKKYLSDKLQLLNVQYNFCSVMCHTRNTNTDFIDLRKYK